MRTLLLNEINPNYSISYNNPYRHYVDFELSTYTLGKEKIEFAIKGLGSPYVPYFINRLSGGISTPSGTNAGLCHKGFKEYKDRKF